jgi:predicted NACHT family NTPase
MISIDYDISRRQWEPTIDDAVFFMDSFNLIVQKSSEYYMALLKAFVEGAMYQVKDMLQNYEMYSDDFALVFSKYGSGKTRNVRHIAWFQRTDPLQEDIAVNLFISLEEMIRK